MIIDIVTIFPEMFSPVLGESIIKRSQDKGLVKIKVHDLRRFSDDPHKKVDSPSYGGGGMVFKVQPLFTAAEKILGEDIFSRKKTGHKSRIILFSPKGRILKQKNIRKYFKYERLLLLAPRYEGVDERVRKYLADEEISIGDYVLSGGELPTMVFVDTLVRLVPGVVSDKESIKNESFEKPLLDFPHYTKPAEYMGMKVPLVLVSGNHKAIADWRKQKSIEITQKRRPDLLKG
ncbi:MAG: tRNA (guanosine(37)-N1)-methyltransferase TrmD [Candidatus Omnitrophica bacterium]|nr:tRNA (guanosine(37)-N1)-methyltransferase TrmD [Candidatus Omnitrophota bacterium]